MEFMSLDFVLGILLLIVGAFGTIVTMKYREVVASIENFIAEYKEAMKDGKLTKKEKEDLALAILDIATEFVSAITKLKWLSFVVRKK